MKIELILLGVIGLVFLIDFIMNSRKKPSIDNVVDQIEGGEPVKTNNPLNYLLKRKKNFTIYVLSIPVIKLLIHFFIYTEYSDSISSKRPAVFGDGYRTITEYDGPYYLDLSHHIEGMFSEKLILFVPAFILVSLVVWFINDKIKAR